MNDSNISRTANAQTTTGVYRALSTTDMREDSTLVDGHNAPGDVNDSPAKFTIWKPSEFAQYSPPEDDAIVAEATGTAGEKDAIYWRDGQLALLVGPGGVGKSRLTLQLAVCQILSYDFLGFKLPGPPRRWLLLGNENSARRVKEELEALTGNQTEEKKKLLEENLRIQAVIDSSSDSLGLDDPEALKRIMAAAKDFKPDVLVIDPWEAFITGGDCNDSPKTRESVRLLRRIFSPHNERLALLIVHHSREGAEAIRKAEGFDAGGYVKGSKTLRSMARFAWNVAPGDAEDGREIVIVCGKINDARKFKTRGATLDETKAYNLNPDFSVDDWVSNVTGKHSGKSCTIKDVVTAVRDAHHTTKEIVDAVASITAAGARTIKRRLSDAVEGGYLECTERGRYELGLKTVPVRTVAVSFRWAGASRMPVA